MKKIIKEISKSLAIVMAAIIMATSISTTAYAAESVNIEETQNLIDDAQEKVDVIEEDPTPIGDLLDEAEKDINNLNDDLNTFNEKVEKVNEAQKEIDDAKSEADKSITKEQEQLENYDNADKATTTDANTAIEDANTANTSDSESEAYAAADNAKSELKNAETGLVEAENAYEGASAAVDEVQAKYDKASSAYEEAQKELQAADQALKNANTDVNDAYEKLKSAKEKMDALEAETEKYSENLDELTTLQEQYYDLMVYYYRAYLGYGKDDGTNNAAYKDDGSINIEESASRMHDKGLDQTASDNIKQSITPLGRYVTGLVVTYMIGNMEDVEKSSITFGKDEEPNGVKQAGVLTEDKYGQDKVLLNNDQGAAPIEEEDKIHWHKTKQKDNGRTNYVAVTYKKKDDPTIYSLKYNYIIKDGNSEGEKDIADGVFYLAQITEKDGQAVYERVEDPNNLDSLSKIQTELDKAILADQQIKDYEAAKEAVDKAEANVKSIQEKINKIQNTSVNDEALNELKKALDNANEDLAKAKDKKDALEDKVEEARKAVAGIDLSRFNKKSTEEETKKPVEKKVESKEKKEEKVESKNNETKEEKKEENQSPASINEPVIESPVSNEIEQEQPVENPIIENSNPFVFNFDYTDFINNYSDDDNDSNDYAEDNFVQQENPVVNNNVENNNNTVAPAVGDAILQIPQGEVLGASRDLVNDTNIEETKEEKKPVVIEDEDVALSQTVPTKGKPNGHINKFWFWWLLLLLLIITFIIKLIHYYWKKKKNKDK